MYFALSVGCSLTGNHVMPLRGSPAMITPSSVLKGPSAPNSSCRVSSSPEYLTTVVNQLCLPMCRLGSMVSSLPSRCQPAALPLTRTEPIVSPMKSRLKDDRAWVDRARIRDVATIEFVSGS